MNLQNPLEEMGDLVPLEGNKLMMKKYISPMILGLFILLAFGLLTGCQKSKVTYANYQQIRVGMTMVEVEQFLGAPTNTSSFVFGALSGMEAHWYGNDLVITLQFVNGKVKTGTIARQKKHLTNRSSN